MESAAQCLTGLGGLRRSTLRPRVTDCHVELIWPERIANQVTKSGTAGESRARSAANPGRSAADLSSHYGDDFLQWRYGERRWVDRGANQRVARLEDEHHGHLQYGRFGQR